MSLRSKRGTAAAVATLAALYLHNASWLAPPPDGPPILFAHRGLPQTFDADGVDSTTCTATRMREPVHGYLENTIPGIRAAFEAGASWVEIDVHPTADGELAVFHDWTLDCRTDGTGEMADRTMAELRALDVGYGYSADGGRTFPFRGRGVGLLPSLPEVFEAFPGRGFVLDIKRGGGAAGDLVGDVVGRLDPGAAPRLMAFGDRAALERIEERLPGARTFSKGDVKTCLGRYVAVGWTGRVPEACRGGVAMVPVNRTGLLWGWPRRFEARMARAGTPVVVVGPWHGERHARGVDDVAWLETLPEDFGGGIWTNRIDVIAPALRGR